MVTIGNDWDNLLEAEFKSQGYKNLREFLKSAYKSGKVYPDMTEIFNALKLTPFADTKAVIIGQDPYHRPEQAMGLCFSVKRGSLYPPSLQNIFKEYEQDTGLAVPEHNGDLTPWAKHGVLLLNSVLTVDEGKPLSHSGKGWELLTERVVQLLGHREKPVVFILWGAHARKKAALIDRTNHKVLECAHPSPLSAYAGFFGSRHFTKTNEFLRERGLEEVDWTLS
ncbi:MAG: uracil-DNA glycosylase [Oscillospiraceae bacterium]|jgi:uracil-DNA glycosylase|nr:uracil-DNA glycosylase [Oscillospiraceae bacterium]